jgi:hypothetical protein
MCWSDRPGGVEEKKKLEQSFGLGFLGVFCPKGSRRLMQIEHGRHGEALNKPLLITNCYQHADGSVHISHSGARPVSAGCIA